MEWNQSIRSLTYFPDVLRIFTETRRERNHFLTILSLSFE